MRWVMHIKQHTCCIPNSNQIFPWEVDLLSITRAGLVHEFEIKLDMSDYKADARKSKHTRIGEATLSPAYFWYVTYGFDIGPPIKAGWISVQKMDPVGLEWSVTVKKEAPQLNTWKMDAQRRQRISTILSFRLTRLFVANYLTNIA